jgi:intracellular sulfur oxidation DsrE/DsrF family protein
MKYFLLLISIAGMIPASAQTSSRTDAPPENKEAKRMSKMQMAQYPLIKSHPLTLVLPVEGVDERPDTTMQYNILFSWTWAARDSVKARKTNFGLQEVGRIINLHIASGIPRKKMNIVVAAYGYTPFALMNNEAYRAKFNTDNPNSKLLQELVDNGVKVLVCGQAMCFLDVEKKSLLPGLKVAYTAQTVLSSYQLRGYVRFNQDTEN